MCQLKSVGAREAPPHIGTGIGGAEGGCAGHGGGGLGKWPYGHTLRLSARLRGRDSGHAVSLDACLLFSGHGSKEHKGWRLPYGKGVNASPPQRQVWHCQAGLALLPISSMVQSDGSGVGGEMYMQLFHRCPKLQHLRPAAPQLQKYLQAWPQLARPAGLSQNKGTLGALGRHMGALIAIVPSNEGVFSP